MPSKEYFEKLTKSIIQTIKSVTIVSVSMLSKELYTEKLCCKGFVNYCTELEECEYSVVYFPAFHLPLDMLYRTRTAATFSSVWTPVRAHRHTDTDTHTYARTRKHAHTHTHRYAHTHSRTQMHAHGHGRAQSL